jgi:type IV secretion system protein VirB10
MNLPFARPGRDEPGSAYDARPIVAVRRKDRSAWWFAGGIAAAAVLLFSALEARRRGTDQAEAQAIGPSALALPEAIPELVVPAAPVYQNASLAGPWAQPGDARQERGSPFPTPQTGTAGAPANLMSQPYAGSGPYMAPPPAPPLMVSGDEVPAASPGQSPDQPAAASGAGSARSDRIQAGRLENPATTVIQGTLINAVMETALDSTSPGQTRAVVTRDIHGFDGTRVLIPRGTRLYGIYEADVAQGQNRAQIRWTRLLRPDGVSVALDSPAADPLGRAGVRAMVNNHFMQRLGNALLGTASAIGSTLVTRNVGNSPVIVAIPGAAQQTTQAVAPGPSQIVPTLTVRQGTRITVFVQHDLDFSSADEAP